MSRIFIGEHFSQNSERADLRLLPELLKIDLSLEEKFIGAMPFGINDITIGTESEYQTAVIGSSDKVDLPITIRESSYFANISRRVKTGDTARRSVRRLEEFLEGNDDSVWENSWVRFPVSRMQPKTVDLLMHDLSSDKADPNSPVRKDYEQFFITKNDEKWIRVPASYLLKLSLTDCFSGKHFKCGISPDWINDHFLNDNSSPETYSFYPSSSAGITDASRGAARENAIRFLLSQCAVAYANRAFSLEALGQKLILYFSPTTPSRIKKLNGLVADSFYRELFMSPCLSGWNKGYEKHEYMHLCHQVLSRSHLNSIFKLKEAGIVTQPLVRLDSISNTSLANNGIHASIGSRMLTDLASDTLYSPSLEKSAGDLVIKITEHFLPLFPGIFSASPWRIAYKDFRPENLIGFLSHELDFTHIRMIWRRWIKKAGLDILGKPLLPYGPDWYEYLWEKAFRFKGDIVPDIRLIDYLVALMSTPKSPALDGRLGNDLSLKRDLAHLGVFDEKMSLYLPFKLREFTKMGFTGFEGRFYSVFTDFGSDMTDALALQSLITAFAWKRLLSGNITHADIPDDPVTESERRQIFFSAAIGLPAISIREKNPSAFISEITSLASSLRRSERYNGQLRVRVREYRLALVKMLRSEETLVESFGARDLLNRLEDRICSNGSTYDKAIAGITRGKKHSPLEYDADDFNTMVENYYRKDLRQKNILESLNIFAEVLEEESPQIPSVFLHEMKEICGGILPAEYIKKQSGKFCSDTLTVPEIISVSCLLAVYISYKKKFFEKS